MNRLWIPFGLSVSLLASTGCSHSPRNVAFTEIASVPIVNSTPRDRTDYYPHLQSLPRVSASSDRPTASPNHTSDRPNASVSMASIAPTSSRPTPRLHPECSHPVNNETWVLIHGQTPGSRVNIRPGPGFKYYDGRYTLVGDSAKVIDQYSYWYKARFAETLHEGWLHCSVIDDPTL